MSQGMILTLLPGAMLLLSPLMGNSIFAMRTATSELRWEHILAFSSQFLIGAILYIGAMRKYRRADAQALTTWLGLLLLAGWVAISATSIFHWDDVAPRFLRSDMSNNLGRFVASLASAMLLALVPVGAAAWADADWRRGKEADDPELGRRPVSPLLASLIAAVVILLLCVVAPEGLQFSRPQIVRSAIVVTAFLLALSYLLRIRHRANQKTMLLGVAWIILTWVGPVAIDLTRHGMSADSDDQVLSVISTCSPIASLAQIWSKDALGKSNVGLVAQTAMAAMLMLWFYTMRPARKPIV
jgi:predicted permease